VYFLAESKISFTFTSNPCNPHSLRVLFLIKFEDMAMPKIEIKQVAVLISAIKSMLLARLNANRVEANHG
jgi:hypothetical protein